MLDTIVARRSFEFRLPYNHCTRDAAYIFATRLDT